MATYGIDFYLRSKYGTATGVQYSAYPFVANEYQYGRLLLSWVQPSGDWTLFRLVKNLIGFPAYSDEGEVLYDLNKDIDGAPPTQYDDLDCPPGNFYYYSIFVGVGSSDPNTATWWRAGNAMNMSVIDEGWTDKMWDLIPRIFQRGDSSTNITDELTDENETLKRFLDIFGYQMNILSTDGQALRNVNDSDRVSYMAIPELGKQLGVDIEPELGPKVARTRVKNAVYINQLKGTTQGIQALISAATGWDADIEEGANMLLNSDQASFIHPTYNQWNAFINYAIGDRVAFNANIYQANVGNYGTSPPNTRTNNTQWNYVGDSANSVENPMTRGQYTWGVLYSGAVNAWAADPQNGHIRLSVGFQSPLDSTVYYSNALFVTNKSGSTTDVTASSVAPINAQAWSSSIAYVVGNYVTSGGKNYRALQNHTNKAPATNIDYWRESNRVVNTSIDPHQIITDGIPIRPEDRGATFTASAYTMLHGIAGGTPAFVRVYIQWYDEYGTLIGTISNSTNVSAYDNFIAGTLGSNMASASGPSGVWTSQAAIARTGLGYVYRNTTTNGYYITLNSITGADKIVAVTSKRFATTGGSSATGNGIIFRYSDANNFYRLRQDRLEKVVGTQLSPPTGLSASVQGSPGTTSTRYYMITATDASGETLTSSELTVAGTPTTYTTTQFVRLTWSAVTGATGYKIYRSLSSGAELLVQTVGAVTTVDDKATAGTTSPPGTNTTAVTPVTSTVIDLTTIPNTFTDGDRMAIRGSGSNLFIMKNGTQIWTGTSTFNQTATQHGLWVGY
jgi:phage tail-like protein